MIARPLLAVAATAWLAAASGPGPAAADASRSRPAPRNVAAPESPEPAAPAARAGRGSAPATGRRDAGHRGWTGPRGLPVVWIPPVIDYGVGVPIGPAAQPEPVDPRRIRVGPPQPAPRERPIVVVVEHRQPEPRPAIPAPPAAPVREEGPGRLWLSVLPVDARVHLDDLPLGPSSELAETPLELASGVHVLVAHGRDGRTERFVFGVDAGQELFVEIDLAAAAGERVRSADRTRIARPAGS